MDAQPHPFNAEHQVDEHLNERAVTRSREPWDPASCLFRFCLGLIIVGVAALILKQVILSCVYDPRGFYSWCGTCRRSSRFDLIWGNLFYSLISLGLWALTRKLKLNDVAIRLLAVTTAGCTIGVIGGIYYVMRFVPG